LIKLIKVRRLLHAEDNIIYIFDVTVCFINSASTNITDVCHKYKHNLHVTTCSLFCSVSWISVSCSADVTAPSVTMSSLKEEDYLFTSYLYIYLRFISVSSSDYMVSIDE
jgi:hypothetical protein